MSNSSGGSATPVYESAGPILGQAAIPVYVVTTGATEGGAALPIVFITANQLKVNGGAYALQGRPTALRIIVKTGTYPKQGGPAIPVYQVN